MPVVATSDSFRRRQMREIEMSIRLAYRERIKLAFSREARETLERKMTAEIEDALRPFHEELARRSRYAL